MYLLAVAATTALVYPLAQVAPVVALSLQVRMGTRWETAVAGLNGGVMSMCAAPGGGEPGRARSNNEDVGVDAHSAPCLSDTRLRNTSSRSGSRVVTSTIPNPSAVSAPSTWPAFTRSLR